MIERVQGDERPDLPIVVGLHFMGADAVTTDRTLFAGLEGNYRFVFPQGQYDVGGDPSWVPEEYYDLDEPGQAEVLRREAALVAEFLTDLARQYPAAGLPTVAGASQGGDLAAVLSLHHSDRVGLCLAIASSLPAPLLMTPATPPPLRLFHGIEDRIAPIERARALASATGAALTEYPGVGHAIPDQMRADLHAAIH